MYNVFINAKQIAVTNNSIVFMKEYNSGQFFVEYDCLKNSFYCSMIQENELVSDITCNTINEIAHIFSKLCESKEEVKHNVKFTCRYDVFTKGAELQLTLYISEYVIQLCIQESISDDTIFDIRIFDFDGNNITKETLPFEVVTGGIVLCKSIKSVHRIVSHLEAVPV